MCLEQRQTQDLYSWEGDTRLLTQMSYVLSGRPINNRNKKKDSMSSDSDMRSVPAPDPKI